MLYFGLELALWQLTTQGNSDVPQLAHKLGEAGSLTGAVGPAAGHEGVKCRWAPLGFGQTDALLQLVYHILVFQPEERLLTSTHNLPHANRWKEKHRKPSWIRNHKLLYKFIAKCMALWKIWFFTGNGNKKTTGNRNSHHDDAWWREKSSRLHWSFALCGQNTDSALKRSHCTL